ncbi:hypothetical protein EON73_02060 [bacterium]|nr:MAG: hypothetical protein EON73_02060 [bacterium]
MVQPPIQNYIRARPARYTTPKKAGSIYGPKKKATKKTGAKYVLRAATSTRTTQTRRRRRNTQSDPASELVAQNYSGGRTMRKNVKNAYRILKANTEQNIYASAFCNRYMANPNNPGSLWIKSSFSGTTQQGVMTLPLNLHNLSATPNFNGSAVTYPPSFYYLRTTDPTSATAVPVFGTQGQFTIVNSSASTLTQNSFPGQTDMFNAVSIKMCLYGTLSRPMKYLIQLVQLKKPYLHPDFINLNTNIGPEMSKAQAFYSELVRPYAYNPCTFQDPKQQRDLKVLKSWVHYIQPRNSSESAQGVAESTTNVESSGAMPHSKLFNIYHKFNRIQRYDWDDSASTALPTTNSQDTQLQIAGANKMDVNYPARIYLMVRALSPVPSYSDASVPDIHPSYDCVIRTYHTNLG